jgi:hypothetical protein
MNCSKLGNHTGSHCFYLCLHMGCWWRRCIACDSSATLDDNSRRWHHNNNGIMTNYPSFHLLAVATRFCQTIPYCPGQSTIHLLLCSRVQYTKERGWFVLSQFSPLSESRWHQRPTTHIIGPIRFWTLAFWPPTKNERRPPCFRTQIRTPQKNSDRLDGFSLAAVPTTYGGTNRTYLSFEKCQ